MKMRMLAMVAGLVVVATLCAQEAQLPVTKDLKVWLKAGAGVTKDETGKVSAWQSQVEPKLVLAQTAAEAQPALVPDAANGLPALRFDGKQDYLVSPELSADFAGDVTVFVVWGSVSEQLYPNHEGRSDRILSAPTVKGADYDTGFQLVTGVKEPARPAVVVAKLAARPQFKYLGVGGMINPKDGLAVGFPLTGDVAEVLFYGAALSDADLAAVTKYLQDKYKIAPKP